MLRSLPLSRTSLISLVIICAAVVLFATGATFAISSSDSASGDVTVASAAISVDGNDPSGSINFSTGAAGCPTALNPGDLCGPVTVTVTNNSPGSVTLSQPTHEILLVDEVSPTGCDNTTTNWQVVNSQIPIQSLTLGSGAATSFQVSVKLQDAAHQGCQGETATVMVTVASQSVAP